MSQLMGGGSGTGGGMGIQGFLGGLNQAGLGNFFAPNAPGGGSPLAGMLGGGAGSKTATGTGTGTGTSSDIFGDELTKQFIAQLLHRNAGGGLG